MDILQREDMIKGLPDAVLFQKAQETGADQFLFVSEIQRRQKMRDSYAKSQSDQPEETIVEQILSGGIAEVGQPNEDMQAAMLSGMPPPQPQGPPMGMPPQGMPPQGPPMGMAPQGMPPQGMPMGMPTGMPMGMPTGMPPQGMPPQGMPMGMAPQGMASGGVVRMANTPHLLENQNHNVPVLVDKAGQPSMKLSSAITVDGRRGSLDRELLDLALADKTPTETVKRDVMANAAPTGATYGYGPTTPRLEMASGGVVRMAGGRGTPFRMADGTRVIPYPVSGTGAPPRYPDGRLKEIGEGIYNFTPTGRTREELAGSIWDYQRPKVPLSDFSIYPEGSYSPFMPDPRSETREDIVKRYFGWDADDRRTHGKDTKAQLGRQPVIGTDRDRFIDHAVNTGVLDQFLPENLYYNAPHPNQRTETINWGGESVSETPVSAKKTETDSTEDTSKSNPGLFMRALRWRPSLENGADVASTETLTETVVDSTGGTSNENLAFDLGQKNAGRLISALQGRPNGNSASAANASPLLGGGDELDSSSSYKSLFDSIGSLPFLTEGVDYTKVTTAINDYEKDLKEFLNERTKMQKFDFKEHALDYGRLISEQESRARKIREDAKKSAGAQALIHLGAGIAEGDLAKGLRGAAESASETTRLGRQEATAEERLARTMQIAEAESKANLGIRQGEAAVALETAAQEMKHANSLAEYEASRNRYLDLVKLLRYKDLSDEPSQRLFIASLGFSQSILEKEMDEYHTKHPFSTPEERLKFTMNLVDQVIARSGETPEARAAAERVKLYNEEQALFGDLTTNDPVDVDARR